jgi:hypothetical protein
MQGAFKFLQNVEGKDLLMMVLKIQERYESCRMLRKFRWY